MVSLRTQRSGVDQDFAACSGLVWGPDLIARGKIKGGLPPPPSEKRYFNRPGFEARLALGG